MKICQGHGGYFSDNSCGNSWPQRSLEAGGDDVERDKWIQKGEVHGWTKRICAVGLFGLSGLSVYTNALGKLPMSLCCYCTWP